MRGLMNKRGAVELSISTIVIVVLGVSMLILGLVLIRTIFKGATSVAEMSDEQLKNQMNQLYGDTKKVSVYPDSKQITVSLKDGIGAFGIGITNSESGSSSKLKYGYKVVVADPDVSKKCNGATAEEMLGLISVGKSGENIAIATGDSYITKVRFTVGLGDPICLVRYAIQVTVNGEVYGSEEMDVNFVA
jgi:hypothetical protein